MVRSTRAGVYSSGIKSSKPVKLKDGTGEDSFHDWVPKNNSERGKHSHSQFLVPSSVSSGSSTVLFAD